jgi:transposase
MTWRSASIPPVPEATAALKAAFPKGNVYVDLHEEFGSMYCDDLFADFYADRGHPAEMAPWRLAMATVMQYMAGLTDRQTADAVRRCMDWKYALSLELTDPGFDFTLLHDFRQRWLTHDGAQRMLDTLLDTCKERGWIKTRSKQRTDSTYVVAAIRRLYYLECVQQAMHNALNQLSEAAPQWVQEQVPLEWYERYGPRVIYAACLKRRANATPWLWSVVQTATSCWTPFGVTPAFERCWSCQLGRFCNRFGCSIITAAPPLGWKTSVGGTRPTSLPLLNSCNRLTISMPVMAPNAI